MAASWSWSSSQSLKSSSTKKAYTCACEPSQPPASQRRLVPDKAFVYLNSKFTTAVSSSGDVSLSINRRSSPCTLRLLFAGQEVWVPCAALFIFGCSCSLLNHGVAQRKRLPVNLGNLNPIRACFFAIKHLLLAPSASWYPPSLVSSLS